MVITYYTKEGKFKVGKTGAVPFSNLHRLDGPAFISKYIIVWYKNGKKHRPDGPAIICHDGTKEWWAKGKRHRVNGPALICHDGTKEWFTNDTLHRKNAPAIIWHNGTKEWYVNGKKHRLDGPAIIYPDNKVYYYINGRELNTHKVKKWLRNNNINLKKKEHQTLFMLRFG